MGVIKGKVDESQSAAKEAADAENEVKAVKDKAAAVVKEAASKAEAEVAKKAVEVATETKKKVKEEVAAKTGSVVNEFINVAKSVVEKLRKNKAMIAKISVEEDSISMESKKAKESATSIAIP